LGINSKQRISSQIGREKTWLTIIPLFYRINSINELIELLIELLVQLIQKKKKSYDSIIIQCIVSEHVQMSLNYNESTLLLLFFGLEDENMICIDGNE